MTHVFVPFLSQQKIPQQVSGYTHTILALADAEVA